MNHGALFLVFSAFAAIVSVGMWLDYFRRIDVFEPEKLAPLFLAVFIGGCTPYLSLYVYRLIASAGFSENGKFIHDMLYAFFGIGVNEELSKILGVIIVFTVLKKHINEPIDVLIYAGVTALGFSMVENFNYFSNHGVRIITSRTFYSALEHIINTSIIVYGFYRAKLFHKGNIVLNTLVAFAVAVCSHGLFDFFLEIFPAYFASFLSLAIYLIGINFWIDMLNNANNYSSFFDYRKINYTPKLVYRLFYWYILTLIIAFVNNTIVADLRFSFITVIYGLLSDGFLFWIVILRVSRFKIFRMKYFKIVPRLPFYFTKNGDQDLKIPFLNLAIKVRGENFQEHLLTKYLHRKVELYPVNKEQRFITKPVTVMINDKHLLFDDVIVYSIKIEGLDGGENLYFLKPKMDGISQLGYRYPVEGLYTLEIESKPEKLSKLDYRKLNFVEWVYLKSDS
jgi:RsiW-degrading membrane proteinase PrsW (M82 family)